MAKANANKEGYVTVKLPKKDDGSPNFQFVALNGKTYKIMRGVNVQVPREVAEILYNSDRASDDADKFIESNVQ